MGLVADARAAAELQAGGKFFGILECMWKVGVGAAALVLILTGAYWFLSGKEPVQTRAAAQATTTVAASMVATTTDSIRDQPMNVTLHTNKGDINIQLFATLAPNTVANFVKLAREGFYDGTKFHRVIQGFMNQGGDPLTKDDAQKARWGTGGPGYTIPDEFSPAVTNLTGTVAMANTGQPNSAGSQFFINAADNHFLDGKYTIFGKVTSGMEVVLEINKVETDSSDRPTSPVVLLSVTVAQ